MRASSRPTRESLAGGVAALCLILQIGTAAAETAADLEEIMQQNVCRSSYAQRTAIDPRDRCGCGGMHARTCVGPTEVGCLKRVNDANSTIYRWNNWVQRCKSRR